MNHDAAAFYSSWAGRMNAMKSRAGGAEIGKAFGPFFQALMKDSSGEGGLDAKQKELIALAVGIASRCDACIYTHVEKCLKLGATPREIMDATGVAVVMGGGPVFTYATVVAAALDQLESSAKQA